MNYFWYFVEGELLWITFILFAIGVMIRAAFFVYATLKNNKIMYKHFKWKQVLAIWVRMFLPFHKALVKKPIYTILRYIFHICLIVVPIWLGGHIDLWEYSGFGWYWTPLPDAWADWMILLVLGLAAYFLFRRVIFTDLRLSSSMSDYLLIVIAVLPFITGYSYVYGTLDFIPFLENNMLSIHILSGEVMLIVTVFLFCRIRLNDEKCTGCGACTLDCPAGALNLRDEGKLRIFIYSCCQCICCGACVNSCPEKAAELRHEISIKKYFQVFSKEKIRTVELVTCEKCGAQFMPVPQIEQIERMMDEKKIQISVLKYCEKCKKRLAGTDICSTDLLRDRQKLVNESFIQ